MNYSLVFPDQLFHKNPSILKGRKVLLLKHPYFFSRFRYNKKKILMHLMSIEYYKRSLESDSFEVEIIELKDFQSLFLSGISQNHLIHTCEISNLELSSFLNELSSKNIQVKYYKSIICLLKLKIVHELRLLKSHMQTMKNCLKLLLQN